MSESGPVATVVSHDVPIEFTRPSGKVGLVSVGHPQTAGLAAILQHADAGYAAKRGSGSSASVVAVRGQTVHPRTGPGIKAHAAAAKLNAPGAYDLSKYL